MEKNFENFQEFYNSVKFRFSVIFFSELWIDDDELKQNFQLQGYDFVHQIRKNCKRGGIA